MYAALSIMVLVSGAMFFWRLNGPGSGILAVAGLLIVAHYAREIVELFRVSKQ